MTIAKADKDDLETTIQFLNAAELALDRDKFSFQSAEDNWEDLDDEDEDKILILKIRKNIAEEEGKDEDRVDNRILMYEFLQAKFAKCNCNWRRVYYAADSLIDFCCDPTEDHLALYPGFELFHVSTES